MWGFNLGFEVFLFFSLFSLLLSLGSYLIFLLCLELLMLSVFFLYSFSQLIGKGGLSLFFCFLFLIMMVFEGVIGLCLVVKLSRSDGSDLYKMW